MFEKFDRIAAARLDFQQALQPLVGLLLQFVERGVELLYSQCEATPASAILCISWVRICTSIGVPNGPNSVVCSDW